MTQFSGATVVLLILSAGLCVTRAAYAQAPFQILHELNGTTEGQNPSSTLTEANDGNFYGTTIRGGLYNFGTIFRVTPAGNFNTVYNFSAGYDGGNPSSALVRGSDGNLYGTTMRFGAFNEGIIFRLQLDGTFVILHAFNRGLDAGQPLGSLVQAVDGQLYGTTVRGGTFDRGAIFRSTLEGDVTLLHSFSGTPNAVRPLGGLIKGHDGQLYGIVSGSSFLEQTVVRFTPHLFTGLVVVGRLNIGVPNATLAGQGPDGSLFGSASCGAFFGSGAVFRMSPDGGVTVLTRFATSCSDSAPFAFVNLAFGQDGRLYGTVSGALSATPDTSTMRDGVFVVAPDGGITPVAVFGNTFGVDRPYANGLTQGRDGMLYGSTAFGGTHGAGTVFRVTPVPGPIGSLLRTTSGQGDVRLLWTPIANANSYTIKRGTTPGAETVLARGVTTASFVDGSVTKGQRYYYMVTALNEFGESTSYEVSVTAGRATMGDFNGDGRADFTVFRPSNGTWYSWYSGTSAGATTQWGTSLDTPVPGDYDGDGRTDIAVFRPSNFTWHWIYSGSGAAAGRQWGAAIDTPVPGGDYNGDGLTDIATVRDGGSWLWLHSGTWTSDGSRSGWGVGGDLPVPADYDGDGRTDLAVFRPSNTTWYLRHWSSPAIAVQWGVGGDLPVPADYDGDGKTDIAVYRPSTGTWHLRYSSTGTLGSFQWGTGTDTPVPGDYDGDGRTDIAVYRPSNGTWHVWYSGTPSRASFQWGIAGDIPILKQP